MACETWLRQGPLRNLAWAEAMAIVENDMLTVPQLHI